MASKFKEIDIRLNIFNLLLLGLIIRLSLAFLFSNDVSFLGGIGSNDAKGFSIYAMEIYYNFNLSTILTGLEYNLYPVILSIVYKFTYPSDFIGNCFTVLIWVHSFFIIHKLLNYLKYSKITIIVSLTYFSISPSICIFSSISLRDFLIFYLLLNIIYFVFRFQNSRKFLDLLVIFLLNYFIYKLHEQFLIILSIFLILFYISYKCFQVLIKYFNINNYFFISIFFLFIFILSLTEIEYFFKSLNNFQSGSLADPTIGRANYILTTYFINDIFGLIYYFLRNFFLYLSEPSFLSIEKILFVDFVIILEKFFKIIVIFLFFIYFLKDSLTLTNQKIIIFIYLIFADLAFSLGTFNWGTAFRHQVITFGLLTFLIAFVFESIFFKNVK